MDKRMLAEMSAEDRLTFLIGRVARLNVELERRSRFVWMTLVEDTVAEHAMPRGARNIIDAITRMIPRIGLTSDESDACVRALKQTQSAYEKRHVLVHEHWMPTVGADAEWHPVVTDPHSWLMNGMKTKPPRDFDSFLSSAEEIEDAIRRMSAMATLVTLVYPSRRRRLDDPSFADEGGRIRSACIEVISGDAAQLPRELVEVFSYAISETVGHLEEPA